MAVTLDSIAQRYGLLPSEVLTKATTLDLQVLDVALSYEKMKMDQADGRAPQYNTDVLLDAMKNVTGRKVK